MGEFASNAKGNAALTTGIIGAAGFGLNLLGGLMNTMGGYNNGGVHYVDRYEAEQAARIAELETEVKFRDSTIYTDQKMIDLYKYIDGKFSGVEAQLAAQAVMNQKTADAFDLVRSDKNNCKQELYKAISCEAEKRCAGDNAIVNYANATFYSKLVADVTAGSTTTAQATYNPLPQCGGCNCNSCC